MRNLVQSMRGSLFILLVTLSFSFTFVSCGDGNGSNAINQVVKGIDLSAINQDGDIIIKASVLLYLKNMLLGHLNLPIFNPNNPTRPYGRLVITPPLDFNGIHKIGFELNLSKIAPIPPSGVPLLPNGRELPFTGIDNSKVIMVDIDAIKSKIYFALDSDLSFMGFAIVISEFDAVGDYTGGIDFFPLFKFYDIIGTAGLFSGVGDDKSGLAFFVNLSAVLTPDIINDILNGRAVYDLEDRVASYRSEEKDLSKVEEFFKTNITKSEENKMMKALYNMTKKKKNLHYSNKK